MLKPRAFGQTDLKLSPLGLGTVKFGRNQGVKYPENFTLPEDKALQNLLTLAKDEGINVLDTAPAYGESEARLGKLLAGSRQDWVLISKVGEQFVNGESAYDFSSQQGIASVEESLKKLNTDYLDFLLVHSNGDDLQIIESGLFETLASLKSQGKIRYFGMSSKTIAGGLTTVEQSDCVMCTYYPGYTDEKPVLDRAAELNKGVFIKKAFASGHLNKLGQDPIQASFDLSFSHPASPCVIVGTINPEHLRENCQVASRCLQVTTI